MYSFYRIPKILFTNSCFKELSCEAKILYGLMLDRMSLSIKNNWLDEENRVYICFSIEEIMELMSCGKNKAVNCLKELDGESGLGLIEKKRLGMGKTNVIYVKKISFEEHPEEVYLSTMGEIANETGTVSKKFEKQTSRSFKNKLQEVSKTNFKEFEKQTSRSLENKLQEVYKTNSNNTELNNTEKNYIESYQSYRREIDMNQINQREEYENLIKENIEYDILSQTYGKQVVDENVELIVETVCTTRDFLKINGDEVPSPIVKKRLLSLSYEDMVYVFYALSNTKTKVKNIRQYMLTVLYNAPTTRKQFYDAEVRHDLGI